MESDTSLTTTTAKDGAPSERVKMTASKYAKQAGLKSLAVAGRISNTSGDGLTRMYKNNFPRFRAIILGCVEIQRQERADSAPLIEAGRYIMATVSIVDGVPVARFEPA